MGELATNSNCFFLSSEISYESAADAIQFIIKHNLKSEPVSHLNLLIMSSGGDCSCALGLIDVIESSAIPIHTYGIGYVASSALFVFITGHKRFLYPNASLLCHQFDWELKGKSHELLASNKEVNLTQSKLINHVAKHSNLSVRQVQSKLLKPSDVWLTSKEAISYGLADEIITVLPS